jgi:hypothetical protein
MKFNHEPGEVHAEKCGGRTLYRTPETGRGVRRGIGGSPMLHWRAANATTQTSPMDKIPSRTLKGESFLPNKSVLIVEHRGVIEQVNPVQQERCNHCHAQEVFFSRTATDS